MHSVARNGVKVVNTNGNGNAVTCISISEGKDITLCKCTNFAKAYNGNASCVEYASKADALNVSGCGSKTRGVYIDTSGKPQQMDYTLGQSIPSTMQIICSISDPLKLDSRTGALSINISNSSNFLETDDTKPITAKAILGFLESTYKLTKK